MIIVIIIIILNISIVFSDIECYLANDFFVLMNNSQCHMAQCRTEHNECNMLYADAYYCGYCNDDTYYYNNCSSEQNTTIEMETCVYFWFDSCVNKEIYYCNNNKQNCNNIQNIICYNNVDTYYHIINSVHMSVLIKIIIIVGIILAVIIGIPCVLWLLCLTIESDDGSCSY